MIERITCEEALTWDSANTVKTRQRAMWGSGDYAVIGATLQIVGEQLNEAANVCADERVLDVAAGSGNATLAAARRFATVTSTDYVPTLLDQGRRRAEAEGFANVTFELADAEALPYTSASFDVVLSTFGVMFAPDHDQTAREMMRVCRPGGRIALANWTPGGFIGDLFRIVATYVPPPRNVRSPLLWGTEPHLRELFAGTTRIEVTPRMFAFRYRSPEHFVDVFRQFYGPVHTAFGALAPDRQAALTADLITLLHTHNRGGRTALVAPGEYLEVVITR